MYIFVHSPLVLHAQSKSCVCNVCHCFTARLHTCLSCVYFGCMSPDNHMQVHIKNTGHTFGEPTHTCTLDATWKPGHLFKCKMFTYQILTLEKNVGSTIKVVHAKL